MFIAIVDFTVPAEKRAAALATLLAEAPTIRAMPGNLAFRPYLDPVKPDALCILHEWEDAESFKAYSGSESFKASGAALRPMMSSAPVSRRMIATLLETIA